MKNLKDVKWRAMFTLGVIYAVFTVVKIFAAFDYLDPLLLFLSIMLIVGAVYFQKKDDEKENRLKLKKAAEEYRRELEKKELLEKKAQDAEIGKAVNRFDDIGLFEKAPLPETEDEFAEMFGFLSVKIPRVFRYFIDGGIYDKLMCVAILTAVFMIFEPFTVYALGGAEGTLALFIVPYLLVTIVWAGLEFWFPVGALIFTVKAVFPLDLRITMFTAVISLAAALMVLIKKNALKNAKPEPAGGDIDDEEGFVTVTPDIPVLSEGEILLSRFPTDSYGELTMAYSTAIESENDGLETLLSGESDFENYDKH